LGVAHRIRTLRVGASIVVASSALAIPTTAHASEGGASFYLLGSGGPGAAVLPPLEGIFFDNTFYYYHGEAKAERQFLIGGNLVAGLDATIAADFATVLWVPTTNLAGGTLAIGGTFAMGQPDIEVDAVVTGPGGNPVAISREDKAFIVADPVATAELSWKIAQDTYLSTTAAVSIPIGHYREGELANLSFHRWIVDLSTAVTWLDMKAGWDVSGKAGFTFNGTNDFTDYDTGTEFHLEGSVERKFSKQFSAGIQAYHYQQVSGDSGEGARLGSFKGRVSAVGVTAAQGFKVGKIPMTLRGRLFKEFGEKNRLGQGTAFLLNLDFPLYVKMPPGAPAAE
jgi:hypothetical protein